MSLEEKTEINRQTTTVPQVPKSRKWYFLDLENKIPGRIAPRVAALLRGKQEKHFLANFDLGSHVVLVNSSKVKFTGNKLNDKYYYNHSGYPGGLRKRSTKIMVNDYPNELVKRIIWGMMPKNKLSRKQIKRLFIFPDEKHNLQAQEKDFLKIDDILQSNL